MTAENQVTSGAPSSAPESRRQLAKLVTASLQVLPRLRRLSALRTFRPEMPDIPQPVRPEQQESLSISLGEAQRAEPREGQGVSPAA